MEKTASEYGEVVIPVSQKTVKLPACMKILRQQLIKVVETNNLIFRQINISFSSNTGCNGSLSFSQDKAYGSDDSFSGVSTPIYGKSRRNRRLRRKQEREAKSKSPTSGSDETSGYSTGEYYNTEEKKDDLKDSDEEQDVMEKDKVEYDLLIEKKAFNKKAAEEVIESKEVIEIGMSNVQTVKHSDILGLHNKVSAIQRPGDSTADRSHTGKSSQEILCSQAAGKPSSKPVHSTQSENKSFKSSLDTPVKKGKENGKDSMVQEIIDTLLTTLSF
jgi:hypothetical protein